MSCLRVLEQSVPEPLGVLEKSVPENTEGSGTVCGVNLFDETKSIADIQIIVCVCLPASVCVCTVYV